MSRWSTTATFGRFWPTTASRVTARTVRHARPICGSISARRRWKTLPEEIAAAKEDRDQRRKIARRDFEEWLASAAPEQLDEERAAEGLIVHVPLNEGAGNEARNLLENPARFSSTGNVTWVSDGKLGPAPVMKAGGTIYGETDDFSYNIVRDPVHIRELHATVLHLLGFDHDRFDYRFQGLDQRLTGVLPARVIQELLA